MRDHPECLLKTVTFISEKGESLEGARSGGLPLIGQNSKHQRPLTGEDPSETESQYSSSINTGVRGIQMRK